MVQGDLHVLGYTRTLFDYGLFGREEGGMQVIITVYVDDIFRAGKTTGALGDAKELEENYEMTDGGELHYILGMEVDRNV